MKNIVVCTLLLIPIYGSTFARPEVLADTGPREIASAPQQECDYLKPPPSCPKDNTCDPTKRRKTKCAKRLYQICIEDQKDLEQCHGPAGNGVCHKGNMPPGYEERVTKRVREIGEIFEKGCFTKAEDYSAAAVTFLHTDRTIYEKPETYLKVIDWARKAVEMGDECHRRYIAYGVHKYFDALKAPGIHEKYSLANLTSDNEGCPCYSVRKAVAGRNFQKQFACEQIRKSMSGKLCTFRPCSHDKEAIPKGTLPGFW